MEANSLNKLMADLRFFPLRSVSGTVGLQSDLYIRSLISQHHQPFSVQILIFCFSLSQITVFFSLFRLNKSRAIFVQSYIICWLINQVWIWLFRHVLNIFKSCKDWNIRDLLSIFGRRAATSVYPFCLNSSCLLCSKF